MRIVSSRSLLVALLPLVSGLAWAQETTETKPTTDSKQTTETDQQKADKAKKEEEKKKKDQFRLNSSQMGGFGGGARDGKTFPERLIGPLGKDLNAYGNWVLTLRTSQVSGTDAAKQWFRFQNNNQFFNTTSLGPFQQQLDMTLMGSLFNAVRVNTSLTNNRVAAQTSLAQLLGFEYESGDKRTKAAFGDVNANLPGNELVTFSRRLVGVQYERELGRGQRLSTVASITRALAKRGSFLGNGTTGPYYMNASQIIPGSEKLFLNGQPLISYEDYELDYILGTVRMKKSRILNREDTVEFSYEAQNFNTAPGILTGLRYELPTEFVHNGRMGVTLLKQTSSAGNTSNRPVSQYFPVSADLASRYTLPSPIQPTSTVEVRYQERLLTEGVNADYILNRDLNYVQLRRSLPADTALLGISSLSVTYTPVPQQGVGGDRQVLGLDTQFTPSKNSRVNVQFGQSQGVTKQNSGVGLIVSANFGSNGSSLESSPTLGDSNNVPGFTGSGRLTNVRIDQNRSTRLGDLGPDQTKSPLAPGERFQPTWNASLGWRNIEPGFTSIESTATALLRSEKGLRGTFTYSPTPNWDTNLSLTDSVITQASSFSTGTTTTASPQTAYHNQVMNLGANWTPDAKQRFLPRMRFTHSGTTQGSGESAANFTSDQVSASYEIPKGNIEASLVRSASKGRSIFAFGYTSAVGTGSAGTTGGLLGGYRDGTTAQNSTNSSSDSAQLRLSLTPHANLTVSTSVGLTANHSGGGTFRGRDTSFSTTYSPLPEKLQLQLNLTDTTNGQNLSGFYNSTSGTTLGGASTGQRTRSRNLRLSYTPNQRLRVEGGRIEQLSLIPGYDNTESKTTDITLDYSLSEKIKLLGQWSQQGTVYVGNTSDSDNQNYIFQMTAGPFKRANFTLSAAKMNFGSVFSSNSGVGGIGGIGGGIGGGLGGGIGGGGLGGGGLASGFGQSGLTTTFVLRSTYAVTLAQRGKGKDAPRRETPLQPFLEWRLLDATSPQSDTIGPGTNLGSTGTSTFHNALNYKNNELRLGTEWSVNSLLSASLDVRFIQMRDRDTPQFSYRARTFNFDLRARFN